MAEENIETNTLIEEELTRTADGESSGDEPTAPEEESNGDVPEEEGSSPVEVPSSESLSPATSAAKPEGTPPRAVTPLEVKDPIADEPYIWGSCTVNIAVQLLPTSKGETYREAIIGIRTHTDVPLMRRVKAEELHSLPECLKRLIKEFREDLPARGEAHAERRRKEQEKASKASKTATKTNKATIGKANKNDSKATELTTAELLENSLFDALEDEKVVASASGEKVTTVSESDQKTSDSKPPAPLKTTAKSVAEPVKRDADEDWFTD